MSLSHQIADFKYYSCRRYQYNQKPW